jgi:asparagine synthase (glutamine-hydrolysing)
MCGLTGFINLKNDGSKCEDYLRQMNSALTHRGPDDEGYWMDSQLSLGLAHRRLSILDLSPQGHQPMVSASERYVIAYNGEVYNFAALRDQLSCSQWRGHSDTEVMLAAIEEWGVEKAVKSFIGMFAFALWDKKERLLHLGRDRLGIKPLYYGWQGNSFVFGSELKALQAHPEFKRVIDRNSLALLMRYNYIPAPYSIYEGIKKLLPGHIFTLSMNDPKNSSDPVSYWSAKEFVEKGIRDPFLGSEQEAMQQFETLLADAVKLRMISDVPLGAFLSGGVDSSTVVALMQAQSSQPVKTFSIGFVEDEYNEAQHAKLVANHLGTDHTELYVTPEEARAVIPRLSTLYDEPFADSSQIPTFLVSQLARKKVTVSLSGDGGDELLAGYHRYDRASFIWNKIKWCPYLLRKIISQALVAVPPQIWDGIFNRLRFMLPPKLRFKNTGHKLHILSTLLNPESGEALYTGLVSHWKNPSSLVLGSTEPPTPFTRKGDWNVLPDFTTRMMFLDLITYLPDDILTKVDRASMGVSLEARVPLLDHRVVEFAARIPMSMKVKNGESKWLLKQILYKHVPRNLIERPKMGFGVPLGTWLSGPLREWAEDLMDEKRLQREGYFNPEMIRLKWSEHLSGKRNWQYPLWDVLMFQAWLQENQS